MSAVVSKISSMLDIATPPNGGITLRKSGGLRSPASSPALNRQSLMYPLSFVSEKKEAASNIDAK